MSKSLERKLSPSFLWGEFMSVIKGSLYAGLFVPQLSQAQYIEFGSELLSVTEKYTLYFIFLRYEQWKFSINAYDFLDVVNHILSVQKYGI
jgi:hypothetical protein